MAKPARLSSEFRGHMVKAGLLVGLLLAVFVGFVGFKLWRVERLDQLVEGHGFPLDPLRAKALVARAENRPSIGGWKPIVADASGLDCQHLTTANGGWTLCLNAGGKVASITRRLAKPNDGPSFEMAKVMFVVDNDSPSESLSAAAQALMEQTGPGDLRAARAHLLVSKRDPAGNRTIVVTPPG